MNYTPLFQPISVGPLRLKTGSSWPPMSVHMTEDGSVSDAEIAYTERRAMGGVSMIIVGSLCIWPDGNFGGQIFIHDDGCIPGLRRLTEAVHRHDCLIAAQLHHAGRETNARTSGFQPVAPSYFEPETHSVFKAEYDAPRVLETREVEQYVEYYAQAVRRAKEAGFDACELHCAHGYLICAFMSPLTNQRSDRYGGGFHARMRFVTEIIGRARQLVGEDYPITCRIVGDELREGGIDMELSVRIARYLESLGVAALSVSAGMYPYVRTVSNMYHKHGVNLYLAENVREAVRIPVMAAGQIDRPEIQLHALETGKADILCIGRTLIADPDYPDKLREGRLDDIIHCIACNKGCHDRSAEDRQVKCALNVRTGRETLDAFAIRPAREARRIMVIGGGPSGMEAARVAALRGHRVELWDDRPRLGGRLRLAAVPPHKARYGEACDYLEREIRKLGVDIHLNAAVTEVELDSRKPDAVILATGSVPFVPPIQGLSGGGAVLVDDVLEGRAPVGRRVAIIGGGAIGAETAHLLVEEEDREVYLIEMRDGIAVDLPQDARICLLHAFEQTPSLHQITNAKVTAVTPESITLERQGQTEVVDRLDTIILAVGARANQGLRPALEALGIPFLVSGDATGPKDYVKAIYEGFVAGNTIAE